MTLGMYPGQSVPTTLAVIKFAATEVVHKRGCFCNQFAIMLHSMHVAKNLMQYNC